MFAFGLAGCGAGSCNSFVDYFRMPLSRNLFLRYKHFIANRAMFAFGLAGRGASSCNSFVDHLGMTRSRNLFNSGDRCAANRAFDARRMTGFRAGGRLFSNINRRMTGCIKHFGLGFAANSTSVSLDTGIAAGRGSRNYALVPAVTLRRDNFLCNKNLIADGAVLTLSLAGCGAGSCNSFVDDLGMSLGGNSRAGAYFLAAILAVGVAGVAGLGAGCFLGITKFCVLMCARRAAPYAFDIVDNIASLGGLRLDIGAVGVVQLGGGDGDGHRTFVRIILIGYGRLAGCALLNVLAGAVAGADVRTALGGVDGANSRYAAVHIHLRINQVVIGAVVCLTRRIGHGLKLAGAPDKVVGVPLIAVIEIDILPVCNCQTSALGNIDLNARQQSGILIDGHISGLDIDGDVIGDGQHIACRVDIHARKR